MTTAADILAVIGQPIEAPALQGLIAADKLVRSDEEDLEEGEPPMSHFSGVEAGYELAAVSGTIRTAFFYARPKDAYLAFAAALPGSLPSQSSRKDVRERFGKPEKSGQASKNSILGRQGPWDRFKVGSLFYHFQFTEQDEQVELVTIMMNAP